MLLIVTFLVSPAGAAVVEPSSVILDSSTSVAQLQVTPNITSQQIVITPVLSGPGAVHFANVPGSNPDLISFASYKSIILAFHWSASSYNHK